MARPSIYSDDLAKSICVEIATTTKGLRRICEIEGMPDLSTVVRWLQNRPDFEEMYNKAKQWQQDLEAEDMIDIADHIQGDDLVKVNRDKLRVNTRQWIAARLHPKKYGESKNIEHNVKVRHQLSAEQFDKLLDVASSAPKIEDIEHEEIDEA